MAESNRKGSSPALIGVESRTDVQGKTHYRGTVYDARVKKHRHGPWTKALAEARSWRIDAQAALRSGHTASIELTVRAALAKFFDDMGAGAARNRSGRRYKPSAVRSYEASYRLHLDNEIGSVRVSDLRRSDLQSLADKLELDCSPSTVRNAMMPLRAYFRWALARDLVSVNVTGGLELPALEGSRERVATPVEASRLLDALPQGDRPIWGAYFYAGLRQGEAQALMISDVDLEERILKVVRSWDPKAGFIEPKSRAGKRRVPLPLPLCRLLSGHLQRHDSSEGLFFGRSRDVPFSRQALTRRADRIWEKSGLRRITPHEARHTYATLMIEAMKRDQTLNLKVLSSIMGHSSITTTYDRYGHLLPGSENQAGAALDAFLKEQTVPKRVPTAI